MGSQGIYNNLITVQDDGKLVYNDTMWDDERVPANTFRRLGFSDPDWIQFTDDGGGSTGVYMPAFDSGTDEEIQVSVQMPHSWKEGTAIYPHVHWAPSTANAGNVVWGMEYSVVTINGVFSNSAIITVTDAAAGTALTHQLSSFSAISMSGFLVSTILIARLFRDANAAADTYGDDAFLLEFDIHYEMDTPGSALELTK